MTVPHPKVFAEKINELRELFDYGDGFSQWSERYHTLRLWSMTSHKGEGAGRISGSKGLTEPESIVDSKARAKVRDRLLRGHRSLADAVAFLHWLERQTQGLKEQPTKVSHDALVTQGEFDRYRARRRA